MASEIKKISPPSKVEKDAKIVPSSQPMKSAAVTMESDAEMVLSSQPMKSAAVAMESDAKMVLSSQPMKSAAVAMESDAIMVLSSQPMKSAAVTMEPDLGKDRPFEECRKVREGVDVALAKIPLRDESAVMKNSFDTEELKQGILFVDKWIRPAADTHLQHLLPLISPTDTRALDMLCEFFTFAIVVTGGVVGSARWALECVRYKSPVYKRRFCSTMVSQHLHRQLQTRGMYSIPSFQPFFFHYVCKLVGPQGKLIDAGAGNGLLSRIFSQLGANLVSYDNFDGTYYAKSEFYPVKKATTEELSKEVFEVSQKDLLMLAWPTAHNDMAYDTLVAFKGQHLIVIGEESACATEKFWTCVQQGWTLTRSFQQANTAHISSIASHFTRNL